MNTKGNNAQAKAVVDTAKEHAERTSGTLVELPFGVKGKIVPVSASLIDEVTRRIEDPEPPKVYIEEKGREEENPNDPNYIRERAEANRKRGVAAMEAMLMFGIDLTDGLPQDDKWLKKLRYLEKLGQIDLSSYDLEDSFELEFLYKRYIAGSAGIVDRISKLSGMSAEEIEKEESLFPSNA